MEANAILNQATWYNSHLRTDRKPYFFKEAYESDTLKVCFYWAVASAGAFVVQFWVNRIRFCTVSTGRLRGRVRMVIYDGFM